MADVRWLDEDEQRVWRRLLAVQARLLARLDDELTAANGLSLGDFEVLVHLSEAPDRAIRMAELASRLTLSPSGLTRRVDGLVKEGMVARRACPSDGRGSLAVLTDEGLARLNAAAATHVAGVRRYLIDALTGPERPFERGTGPERPSERGTGPERGTRPALDGLAAGLAQVERALDSGEYQPGSIPAATSPPRSIQPLVPPATDTAV